MLRLKRILFTSNLASLLVCYSSFGHAYDPQASNKLFSDSQNNANKSSFYIGLLYIKPYSNNLKYATFVSGIQPYYQSWHYQEIDPNYHPAFEIGLSYAIPHTSYSAALNWTHLNSNDNSSKQASTSTNLTTVEFVAPPYEMSPPVFGIKGVNSKVNFDFDNVLLNGKKLVEFGQHVQAKFSGGLSVLKLNHFI